MALIANPFQFKGTCSGCGKKQDGTRAAVAAGIDEDPNYEDNDPDALAEWICARCATRFAKMLLAAVARARANVAKGLVYRNDVWRRPSPKRKRAA